MPKNEKADDTRFHINVERVTCVQSMQERVVISCNVRADLSLEAIAGYITKMGDAALKRVEELNKRWDASAAESFERKSKLAEKVGHLEALELTLRNAADELRKAQADVGQTAELEPATAIAFALAILEQGGPEAPAAAPAA